MRKGMFNGLRTQISLFYLLASLGTVMLIGFILYYSISEIVLQDALDTTTMAVDKSGDHIESYVSRVKDISLVLAEDPGLIRYLRDVPIETDVADILTRVDSTMNADTSIASIIIVGKGGQLLSNESSLDMSMSNDMMKESWYVDVIGGDGMPSLTSARMQKFNMDKDQWVISLSREIKDDGNHNLGVIVVDFKYSVIETYLNDLNLGNEGYVYLLNSHEGVVYHKDTDYFENVDKQAELINMSQMEQGYDSEMNLLFHQSEIEGTDWQMYGVASLDGLNAIRRQLIETIVLIGIISVIAMFLSGTWIAGRITNPIKDLEGAMAGIEQGLTFIEVDSKGCNEAISLAQHYNHMVGRIKDLMKDIEKNEQSIRSYELNVLHSQINPHFLYNTLDTIVWMAEFGDSEKVIYITKSLAQFFRLSLSGGSETTTIGNEMDHVRQYLKIQKERYDDQLNFVIEDLDSVSAVKIPKIILQPIVENSIYHGIRDLDHPGHIVIRLEEQGDDILFTITDDGVGFDLSEQEVLPAEKEIKLGGVGIKNVDQRLKLTYGEAYGLLIESIPGKGTTVSVKVHK